MSSVKSWTTTNQIKNKENNASDGEGDTPEDSCGTVN